MILKRKIGLVLIVILTLNLFLMMPQIEGALETQNIYIVSNTDDGFVTEAGNWFYDSASVIILDPNMDTTSYVVFQDLEINRWEFLNNATLRLYSPGLLPADPDSKVTIYGVNIYNFLGFENGAQVLSAPLTSAFYNVNTSAFTGGMQYIDVTEIVRELSSVATWTGDGHSGTENKDNMGFIIFGSDGHDSRYFYDSNLENGLGPRLTIIWGDEPAPPTPPGAPPSAPDPILNETIGNNTIWEIPDPNLGENRTGGPPSNYTLDADGIHINWNVLNQTGLVEFDSAANVFPRNATWVETITFTKSTIGSLYNDTGAPANITSFFVRFKVNVTDINMIDHNNVPGFVALSTSAPTGTAGMAYGAAGEFVGLWINANADDLRWRVQTTDRDGAAQNNGGASTWFNENDVMLYFEVTIHVAGGGNEFIIYNIYNDPLYRDLNQTRSMAITLADGPMRYAQVISGIGQAGTSTSSINLYTFLTPVDLGGNTTWCVSDINGTIISCDFDDYEDAKDFVDDLLGFDPSDPDPPYQDWPQEGAFTRFRFRFYFLFIGFIMIFGPLIIFSLNRPDGYTFTIGLFIMLIGFAIWIAAGSV